MRRNPIGLGRGENAIVAHHMIDIMREIHIDGFDQAPVQSSGYRDILHGTCALLENSKHRREPGAVSNISIRGSDAVIYSDRRILTNAFSDV